MTNSQRRLSLDLIRSNALEFSSNKNNDKNVLRMQKISKQSNVSNGNQSLSTRFRAKSSIGRISMNAANAQPVFGDHKTILDGLQLLELIKKYDSKQMIINYSPQELNRINWKRDELQKLLREKCKRSIRKDCLSHLIKANALVQELRNVLFDDTVRLNVIQNKESDDKRRAKVLEAFVKNSSLRKNLAEDIDQRSRANSLITNTNRLINVTHICPKDDGLELVVEKTVKELKWLRLLSIHLLRVILELNVEIMSSLMDSLPFQCLSNICISTENFNKHLVCDRIKRLDIISIVAENQAKVTTNRFLYYLYNEMNKNVETLNKREYLLNNSIERQLHCEDITSDYFSASSHSTSMNPKTKSSALDLKIIKDFKIIFNILIQSNQRVLLKIIFGHQESCRNDQAKSSGYRQRWVKSNEEEQEKQQKLCQEFDKQFWNKFWAKFDDFIKSSLCFGDTSHTSVPISVLYNETKAILINNILEYCIRNEESLQEAIKSLELAQYRLLFRLSFRNYSQNYSKFIKLTAKSSLKIESNRSGNRIGTLIGWTVFNAIGPLLVVRMKCNGFMNTHELIADTILDKTLHIFLAFVERKQSLELNYQLSEFMALSIFDLNNLYELLSTCDLKWIHDLRKSLNLIKTNALLRSKQYMFSKSFELLLKNIPTKQYRRKICSTNSEWIENSIRIMLEPIANILSKDQSFDATILLSNLIEEFAKAFIKCVLKDNRIQMNFSHSGAVQFNKDVDTFWDWVVTNSSQSTNVNAIIQLKSISFSLVNRDISVPKFVKRHNRISPTVSPTQPNLSADSSPEYQSFRTNYTNCLTFLMCFHH